MWLKHLLIAATTLCFLLFSLGIYRLSRNTEANFCQMTYMFQNPQYARIPLKNNYYGLYYYNEGNDVPSYKDLNGAPVLFVPGNGGSYKQVRSLGSVALRMGMGYNKPHLDYFTIDFKEELTALYGGYLSRQRHFLKQAINTVLRLYKTTDKSVKRKIVIVGHSMGGVVAKSLLTESDWLRKIAIVIFVSTPLDQPVIYADKNIDFFYQQSNQLLPESEADEMPTTTDVGFTSNTTKIANIVLISIGGGSRDKLVPASLTESLLSDIHVISTAVPNVWVSCDHLAAVWCLQLMKVVNKFLYAITFQPFEGFTFFGTSAVLNLQAAQHYFVGAHTDAISTESTEFPAHNWTSTRAHNFYKIFENGIKGEYQHAVLYDNVAPYEYIYIAVTHELQMDHGRPWIFGCQHNICVENQMLTQQIMLLPSKRGHKTYAMLNLAAIFSTFSSWTHLLIHLESTKHYADLYIDVHNADERLFAMKAPHWYQFMPKKLEMTTAQQERTMIRKLQISDLCDEFYAFKLKFDFSVPNSPKYQNDFETLIKIYAPWAPGYERFYTFTMTQGFSQTMLVHLPKYAPDAYKKQIYVDIHTDPWCSMNVSYRFALADTMRNIVQHYYHWLPAHMTLIVISGLGSQFRSKPSVKNYADFLQFKSWYFVIAVRLANSAVTKLTFIPQELLQQNSIKQLSSHASLIVHGFAVACCIGVALSLRLLTKLASKLAFPNIDIPKMHLIFAVVIACISIACSKCVSLAIIVLVHIILIASAIKKSTGNQKDELEKLNKETTDTSKQNEDQVQTKAESEKTEDHSKDGFYNLDFHIDLLVLIFLLLLVNLGDAIAWFKSVVDDNSYHAVQTYSSLLFTPVILVIFLLPLLWYLKAPSNVNETPLFSIIFNIIAALSLLLCEEKFYRLNYVIACVVALLVFRELLSKSLRLIN